ncbi:hypothetical protein AAG570_010917 [Ranatra chinensis]|uniref:Cytochrome P450 n=1 Tax=Ranatra chinensis TaxID=642074 RepID=A0ABD0YL76_9HEMI
MSLRYPVRSVQCRRLLGSSARLSDKMVDSLTGPKMTGQPTTVLKRISGDLGEEDTLQTDALLMTAMEPLAQETAKKAKAYGSQDQEAGQGVSPVFALPFTDMPGPLLLRVLNRFWQYLPVVGTQLAASLIHSTNAFMVSAGSRVKFARNIRPYEYLFNEYGPVVRLHGPFGGDMVMLSHPDDIRAVYTKEDEMAATEQEGTRPQVTALLDSMEAYRRAKPQTQIPVPELEIGALRQLLTDELVHRTDDFEKMMIYAADNLINRMSTLRSLQEELPPTFIMDLYNWSVECVMRILFGRRLEGREGWSVSETNRSGLCEAVLEASRALASCESGTQFWRIMPTPSWTKLSNACDILEGIISRSVRLSYMRLDKLVKNGPEDSNKSLSFFESMLVRENLSADDALTRVLDIILIGVNTAVNTTGFLMYHIARNAKIQKTLFEEVTRVVPRKDSAVHYTGHMNYLTASITETVRLNPPFPYVRRQVTKDTVVHGYTVPKGVMYSSGTYVVMANEIAFLREDNFEEAHKFKPERWLEGSCPNVDPLDVMPYCRTYPKQLLYQQIAVLIAKVIRNFKIEYNYGPITTGGRLLAAPSRPFMFRIMDRP